MSISKYEASDRTYLFQILEGPTYNPDELTPILDLLSRRFNGEVWSYGPNEADIDVGTMHLKIVKDRYKHRFLNYLNFRRQVIDRAKQLRGHGHPRIAVNSYDPFKTGLLAWQVSKLLGGAFICEVNGQYGDSDNFASVRFQIWKRIRLLQMKLLGTFVIRQAHGLRLLFDKQLDNFTKVHSKTVVRIFFALCFLERFFPAQEEPFILCVGFPFERKGVDLLASAFAKLCEKYPHWKLVLIGHRIPEKLRAYNLSHPNIETHPGMSQHEVAKWMSRCAIYAMPSRSEAMGRVFIEAAAAGKPRIGTRVGGIPTVIDDGEDGITVQKENLEQLIAALDRLMGNPTLRMRMGTRARKRALSEFSGERYLALFDELISASLERVQDY